MLLKANDVIQMKLRSHQLLLLLLGMQKQPLLERETKKRKLAVSAFL